MTAQRILQRLPEIRNRVSAWTLTQEDAILSFQLSPALFASLGLSRPSLSLNLNLSLSLTIRTHSVLNVTL